VSWRRSCSDPPSRSLDRRTGKVRLMGVWECSAPWKHGREIVLASTGYSSPMREHEYPTEQESTLRSPPRPRAAGSGGGRREGRAKPAEGDRHVGVAGRAAGVERRW
jgi:hypothetical protein